MGEEDHMMKAWKYIAAGRVLQTLSVFVVGLCSLLIMLAGPAWAQTKATTESLQSQIEALQQQIDALKKTTQSQNTPAAASAPSQTASSPGGGKLLFTNTDVKITLGGFIEATGIYRDRFMGSDVNSKWNLGSGGFPLQNSPNYYMNETRGTARQSRLSLLAQGQEDYASLAAYYEMDFLGGGSGTSGNSVESNSYNPRIRHLYATYDSKGGWHLLAGQAWSLITMNKKGIVPRQEVTPLVIEAQYVPGFTWTRNPQVRLVKDFGSMVSVGLSVEAPQAIITGGGLPSGSSANYTFRLFNPANFADVTSTANNSNMPGSLSLDQYPDIVGKVAVDPGFGHWEAYGLGRFFTDRTLVNGSRSNETTFGWGAGGAVLLPVIPKYLDFQGSFLAGKGIGRYGSAGFSDAVVNPITGKLDPITEVAALVGLVAHPNDRLDIYGYAGMEQVAGKGVFNAGAFSAGFGNPAYAPQSLIQEGSTASSALVQANTAEQATVGFWYSFYKGKHGLMRLGLSDSYTRLRTFNLPSENINIVMMSLRYYPF
jgi:hypothetical protein